MPSILEWIRAAKDAGYDTMMMNRLNFIDLQREVIEYRIVLVLQDLKSKEDSRLNELGIARRKANADDIDRL
ncbi:MAG: hypothetical protein AB7E61_06410 [Acholeplasmataceae bacterium]